MSSYCTNKLFYFLIFSIFLVSCGKPPANTPVYNGLSTLCSIIDTTNVFSGDTEKLKQFFIHRLQNSGGIDHFPNNCKLEINSYYDLTSDLFFSLDRNRFYLVRGFYITYDDKDMYLSLDNQKWAAIYHNPLKNKGKRYFEGDYHIKHSLNEEQTVLKIDYTMAVRIFDEPNIPYTNMSFDRQVVNLADLSGDILYLQKDKDMDTFLTELILYVPPKTICSVNGIISGNLINCEANKQIDVKFVRDIFLFSKTLPSMSFDGNNWNTYLFKFKNHFNTLIIANKNQEVDYSFDWTYNYE